MCGDGVWGCGWVFVVAGLGLVYLLYVGCGAAVSDSY